MAAPVMAMQQNDIHQQSGLSCAGCHGGDPTQDDPELAMNPRKGFVGKPARRDIPRFCGKCHSDADFMKKFNPLLRVDQVAEYYTSVHGERLQRGDQKVATCTNCHGYHGVRAVNDPNAAVYPLHVAETCGKCHANAEYMRPYSIPTDQLAKYLKSVHATALLKNQDLSAPTCNDCHGNHGAAPPGVNSVVNVCGTCHTRQDQLFKQSPHEPAFQAMGLAGCVVCHSNHEILHPTDKMLGVTAGAVCIQCHSKSDAGYEAASKMRSQIDELNGNITQARDLLNEASSAGMEVSRAQFELNNAHEQLINARVVIHKFSPADLEKVVTQGLEVAKNAHEAGVAAMKNFHFRRKGLAASLIVISLALIALYFKLRQMEGRGE
jgi:predicted CXXCH cytochrome family protein